MVIGLISNVVYMVGAACFVFFAVLELNGRERDNAALVSYTIAFVLFLFTGLMELFIDIIQDERAVRHGRYGFRKSINLAVSFLFMVGTMLDTAAFFLWIDRLFVTEHRLLYASSHVWLVTAIVALIGKVPLVNSADAMDMLDDAGNLLFFAGCVIDCVVRYTDTNFESGSPTRPVAKLEFSSSPIWLVSAICYIVADSIRVHKIRAAESTTVAL